MRLSCFFQSTSFSKAIFFQILIVVLSSRAIAAPENMSGCFVRNYSKAHLASHQNQLVTDVRLLLRPDSVNRQHYDYDFLLQIKMRGRDGSLETTGFCKKSDDRYHCSVECDGGGIDIVSRAGYVLMYLDRIRMVSCSEAEANIDDPQRTIDVTGGLDDHEFHIDRVTENLCRDMRFD